MATSLDAWQERLLEVGDLVQVFPTWEPAVPAIVTYSGPGKVADHIIAVRLLNRARGYDRDCLATRLADIRHYGRQFAFPYCVINRETDGYAHPRSPLFSRRRAIGWAN